MAKLWKLTGVQKHSWDKDIVVHFRIERGQPNNYHVVRIRIFEDGRETAIMQDWMPMANLRLGKRRKAEEAAHLAIAFYELTGSIEGYPPQEIF